MKRIFLFLLVIFCVYGCQTKVRCGSYYIQKRPAGKSEVISIERKIGLDSANSIVEGVVISKMKVRSFPFNKIEIDTLPYATILLVDKKTGKLFERTSDIKGKYSFDLPSSEYNFRIKYIGYNALVVKNISIKRSENIELNALVEFGRDSSVYELTSKDQIKLIYSKHEERR